jgi:hypothetical protein
MLLSFLQSTAVRRNRRMHTSSNILMRSPYDILVVFESAQSTNSQMYVHCNFLSLLTPQSDCLFLQLQTGFGATRLQQPDRNH